MKQLPVFIAMMAVAAADAVPSVSNIELATVDGREMTVTYDLADGPAVVTLSIETNNGSAWLPMDDKVVSRAMGDVNRKITAFMRTIVKGQSRQRFPQPLAKP